MTKYLMTLLLAFCLFSCDAPTKKTTNLYELAPEKSSYILESENITSFLNEAEGNAIFSETNIFKNANSKGIKNYTSLFPATNSLLSLIDKDSLTYDYLYLSKQENDSLVNKPSKDFSVEAITTKDFSYKKTTIDKSIFYSAFSNGVLIASNSLKVLKGSINNDNSKNISSENFKKAVAAKSKGKTSLYVHDKFLKNSIADWSMVDLDLRNNQLKFNGIALTNKQSNQILNIFQGVQHQKNEIAKVTPASANGFYSFTYNDFNTISKSLRKYRGDSLAISKSTILSYTKEAGVIFVEDGTAIALTLVDPELAMENFPIKDELKAEFRGIPIYSASEMSFLESFEPLIKLDSPKYYMLLENFLIHSESEETLRHIISNFQNSSTLDKNASFEKIQEDLADASSLLIVTRPQLTKAKNKNSIFINKLSPLSNLWKNYSLAATQFVSNDGFTHIHGVILDQSDIKSEELEELVTTTLPINITGNSYVLKNHSTKEIEIAVQDESNVLSLLDLNGKVLWKKKLQTKIIGDINQVDLFKNGNLQMAFTTLNRFHVLDRNGKEVKPFPIEFKDDITQPLAVFDYDNTKNYRFIIVQNRELLMYDSKGNNVKGFDFKKASSEITQSPKHIRLKNKDYIVFPEKSGKLNILSRQGKERVSVKRKFQFSENEWYENKNEFISVLENGELVRINQNGKISKDQLTSEGNVQIIANESTLVLVSENILTINEKELTLDFGLYSKPQIFSVTGKTYISITDTQAKKVYLFNERGELAPNFPVYGVSLMKITNSKTRNKTTMLVLGESDEVISYEF